MIDQNQNNSSLAADKKSWLIYKIIIHVLFLSLCFWFLGYYIINVGTEVPASGGIISLPSKSWFAFFGVFALCLIYFLVMLIFKATRNLKNLAFPIFIVLVTMGMGWYFSMVKDSYEDKMRVIWDKAKQQRNADVCYEMSLVKAPFGKFKYGFSTSMENCIQNYYSWLQQNPK